MPSKKQYNLVHNDEYDTRIPLHSEEAFHRGIVFHAKFIGSMEVPRPTSRMEIVAAMRRIRYEFKAKGIKKKKVTLEVSVDGLKVTLRKKKSQAMRVVRTVGQAFEVCHKLSLNNPPGGGDDGGGGEDDDHHHHQQLQQLLNDKERLVEDGESNRRGDPLDDCDDRDDFASLAQPQPSPSSVHKDISLLGDVEDSILDQPCPLGSHHHDLTKPRPVSPLTGNVMSDQLINGELTALKHEIQLLRERLEQQSQQTRAAVAHARLLQDQLAAETAARVEAQARTHQLLVQNKELLEHIAALVSHLREHERISGVPLSGQPGQVNSTGAISQGSAVADITGLGQYNLAPWDQQCTPRSLYPPLNSYYPGLAVNPLGFVPRSTCNSYADELRYQAKLWESLQGANPYAVTPSPISAYTADPTTSPPHYYGYGFTLSPNARARSVQPPASPQLIRPSPNELSHQRSRSLERPVATSTTSEATFIKPLPCRCRPEPRPSSRLMNSMRDLVRPLVLDQPMQQGPTRGTTRASAESRGARPVSDFMPKIDESEDERVAQSPRSARRNSR